MDKKDIEALEDGIVLLENQLIDKRAALAVLRNQEEEKLRPWDQFVSSSLHTGIYTAVVTKETTVSGGTWVREYILLSADARQPSRHYDALPEDAFVKKLAEAGWKRLPREPRND